MRGTIFDIRKFSLHDGPGIRTAVFFKGCPLACPWCHNPEGRNGGPSLMRRRERCIDCLSCLEACPLALPAARSRTQGAGGEGPAVVDPRLSAGTRPCRDCPDYGLCARVCPAEAIQEVGRSLEAGELLRLIRQDRVFYEESGGGVTFTGGEPLAQPGLLVELLDACRVEGIHSAVETSGYAKKETLLDIGARAELLLYDLKHAEAGRGSELTGVDYALCLSNLGAAAAQAEAARAAALETETGSTRAGLGARPRFAKIILRMPIIPGLNDSREDLEAAAALVAELPGAIPVQLLPYHDSAKGKYRLWGLDYPLAETPVPEKAALAAALELFAARGIAASIGG